jgi:hypothetical protein
MNKKQIIEGHLYCFYNEAFKAYGEYYFKLGRTRNLRKRLSTYQTGYIQPGHYVSISIRRFRDSAAAEALLFYLLRRYRVAKNREFFHAPLSLIRHMLIRVESISDDRIDKITKYIIDNKNISKYSSNDTIDELIDKFEEECKVNTSITRQPGWNEELKEYLEEWFEKYRFKPKQEDIAKYKKYGYKPVEDLEMNNLLDNTV